jgi:aminopeptidase-like protein/aminoglycoside N3'-acetyltransferase
MTGPTFDFRWTELGDALHAVGIGSGDVVFVHVDLGALGQPEKHATPDETSSLLLEVLLQLVGRNGTILVPAYSFSFCRRELFDVQRTSATEGPWSPSTFFLEYFRQLPNAIRSADPIHSVAGVGPKAAELLANVPPTCFGENCVFDRFRRLGGKICAIGVGLHEATFLHHVEETANVPFRYKKLFTGQIRSNGVTQKKGWIYNVRIPCENSLPDEGRLEQKLVEAGVCREARVGKGRILGVASQDHFAATLEALAADPWFTAKGPAVDPLHLERGKEDSSGWRIKLPPGASMAEIADAIWAQRRDIVSDGYDACLKALATQIPMTIHEYASGTECWTWIVPEKWTCHEAYLETLEGKRLFSYSDHPLHVVSYSLPFEGEISRQELLTHLHVHPRLQDAVPFVFKYYERDWGLCCSRTLRDSLKDERYRVVIRSSSTYGTLKVGEVVATGSTGENVILCAHLCHPAMANDDVSGIVVGLKVMQELLKRRDLRFTYRLLIVPETIGSLAYLSHHESLIPKMEGGLFLEMLGLRNPHALQLSFLENTEVDLCFTLALKSRDQGGWTGRFLSVIGNDERQFNGPGVRVPMLSLSRVSRRTDPDYPYPEYHSSADTRQTLSVESLENSCDLVLAMIQTLEADRIPVNKFKGEVFCSRYGIHIDWYTNPQGNESFVDVMHRIDGTRSIAQIARECGISFEAAAGVVSTFHREGLVEYR